MWGSRGQSDNGHASIQVSLPGDIPSTSTHEPLPFLVNNTVESIGYRNSLCVFNMSLAHIECLPAELIQPIFLASGPSLALPLVSHRIAAKLCDARIYDSVCTQLLTTSSVYDAAHSRNQTMLFAAKWMTWDFFKAFILKAYADAGCLCGRKRGKGCLQSKWPPDFDDATTMVFSRSHWPTLTFVKARLPLKLLQGPWTQEKIQFLRFLLWTTSMTVDWADPVVMGAVREGKRQAFLARNLEAVQLFNHNRRLGRATNLEQVRFAVMEAGCDRSIVYDTMANARNSGMMGSDWNCPKLDQWCQERIEAGNPKGQWLKAKLEELRHVTFEDHKDGDKSKKKAVYGFMDPDAGDYGDENGTWPCVGIVLAVENLSSANWSDLCIR